MKDEFNSVFPPKFSSILSAHQADSHHCRNILYLLSLLDLEEFSVSVEKDQVDEIVSVMKKLFLNSTEKSLIESCSQTIISLANESSIFQEPASRILHSLSEQLSEQLQELIANADNLDSEKIEDLSMVLFKAECILSKSLEPSLLKTMLWMLPNITKVYDSLLDQTSLIESILQSGLICIGWCVAHQEALDDSTRSAGEAFVELLERTLSKEGAAVDKVCWMIPILC